MSESKILVIEQKGHCKKIFSAIEKFKDDEIVFVGHNNNSKEIFNKKNVAFRSYDDYISVEELKVVKKNAFLWVKKWPDIKIKNNKSFKEIFTYRGTSLWWFVETWFYEASMFHYFSIDEIIKNIEIVTRIIDKENPDRILLVDDNKLLSKTIRAVAESKGIQIILISGLASNLRYSLRHFIPFSLRFFKELKGILREFAAKLPNLSVHKNNKKIKILMITHPTYRQISLNPSTGDMIREDNILGPVIRELDDEKYEKVVIDTDPFPTFRLNFLFAKGYKHIEGYLNGKIRDATSREAKNISKKWSGLKKDEVFRKSLSYKGIGLFDLLEDKFSELSCRKFVEAVKYIEMMDHVVKEERPKLILIVDEYGLYGKAAVLAGKINKIQTIAIQHGIIGPYHFGYYHAKGEIAEGNVIKQRYCPIPNKTVVSGRYYKKILIRTGSYPPSSVVIAGQPKYDVLAFSDKIYKKENIYGRLKIDPNKKLIFFASQPDSPQAKELLFRSVFEAIKKIPNVQMIIKLHPNEYDKSLHEKIAKEVGIDVVITKDINLFELLYACDLMMTSSSTVAIEAMILNKPVVTVNLTGMPDAMPFAKSGAAIGVYRAEDIYSVIVKALNDEQTRKSLESNRRKFVYDTAFKIDGQASRRIINLIKEMLH